MDSLASGGVEVNKSKNWSNAQGMLLAWPTKKDKKYSDQYEVGARLMAALGIAMGFDNNTDIKAAIDRVVNISYKDEGEAGREIVKEKIRAVLGIGSESEKKAAEVQPPTIPITDIKVNSTPQVVSEPLTDIVVGQAYFYQVKGIDLDNDLLAFSLEKGPNGMTIDSLTGAIHWGPSQSDLGKHYIEVMVSDGKDKTFQSFYVMVKKPANQKPVIISKPLTTTEPGEIYNYIVQATDPNNDKGPRKNNFTILSGTATNR